MMVRQLYNMDSKEKRQSVTVEVLQATKLHNDSTVEYVDLSEMEPQVMREGKVKAHGVPLEVDMLDGEFLMAVTRTRVTHKGSEAHIRVLLYSSDKSRAPITTFAGFYGASDNVKNQDYWKFPLVDATVNLHSTMFPTVAPS